jgi:hypothetical protein
MHKKFDSLVAFENWKNGTNIDLRNIICIDVTIRE